ncbi:hypothetical protein LCGC14_0165270 [marine sediment metagenome]|uniref:SWIM-type domain-containing protein n=1 Tax=marine sediment metagenome TaxID=412755 RepID=A0A0F9XWW2_9ZZZZ
MNALRGSVERALRAALNEETYQSILRGVDPDFIHHAQHAAAIRKLGGTKYEGTEFDRIMFTTPSETGQGRYRWNQTIVLQDLPEALESEGLTLPQKVNLAVSGDLKVHCDCPAFQYWGYNYVLTQLDTSGGNEKRFPGIRNPRLRGTICKHLDASLRALPFWINNIASELKRAGYGAKPRPTVTAEV